MGVMSMRLYCFWQPSELQPSARSLEELQIESITIYFDAWEGLDIDLRWWQFPGKCWGNQSGWGAGALCESLPCAIKTIRNSQGHNSYVPSPDNQPPKCLSCTCLKMVISICQDILLCFLFHTNNREGSVWIILVDGCKKAMKGNSGNWVTIAWRVCMVCCHTCLYVWMSGWLCCWN